jgi:pilin isopeptide linkage protein
MDKKKTKRSRSAQRPLGQRALALVLTFLMVFASSGMSIRADDVAASAEETEEAAESTEAAESAAEDLLEATVVEATEVEPEAEAATEATEVTEAAAEEATEATEAITTVETTVTMDAPRLEAAEDVNLANYLTDKTTMHITVYVDGKKYTYTPEELTQKGLTVPKGAPVKVELYFSTISGVTKGQKLVLKLPDNLMDYSGANSKGIVWEDVVWETNNAGAEVEAADWVIDKDGILTVTLRDDFFDENQQDGIIDLFGFNIKFSGNLSSNRGENSGNDDDVVTFRGETNGTGKISFTIPFEYKNENANVEIEKTLVNYDPSTRTGSYQVVVTAPSTNTYTATNVTVKDKLSNSSLVETTTSGTTVQYYRNATATTGTFNSSTGVWTIGDMKPGATATLTYKIVIANDALSGSDKKLANDATLTFNDDGVGYAHATLQLPTTTLEKSVVKNSKNGGTVTTDSKGPYIEYKLTVSATDETVSNVDVVDAFENFSLIEEVVIDNATVGNAYLTTTGVSWRIDTLTKGTTATLTYKAYLDVTKWESNTSTEVQIYVRNNATLSINDSTTGKPTIVDSASTYNRIDKQWVTKVGELKENENHDLMYTVKVNADPVSNCVTGVYDILTGGNYDTSTDMEIVYYTASDKKTKVGTKKVSMSTVVSSTSDGERWDLNLSDLGIAGSYYYEITYYVKSTGVSVSNSAGIGIKGGGGPSYVKQMQGSEGFTYGSQYSKSMGISTAKNSVGGDMNSSSNFMDYKAGLAAWTVTVNKTIPEGAVFHDRVSDVLTYTCEAWWFDDATLAMTKVKLGDTVLVAGEDYTIAGVWNSENNGNAKKTDPDHKRYDKFTITFNKEIAATASNKLTIEYYTRLNTEARDESDVTGSSTNGQGSYVAGGQQVGWFANYCKWSIPSKGTTVTSSEGSCGTNDAKANVPLYKSDGKYDEKTGTITWDIDVNATTTIEGDATLEEYLPAGLTFVSASITGYGNEKVAGGTTLGDITTTEYTDDDGNTAVKVIIPVKDLVAYKGVSGGKVVDFVSRLINFGQVTVTVVTKVDAEWYMNLTEDQKLTNKAVLKDNTAVPNGVTATGTVIIPHKELLDKSMAGKENPAYVEYALNVNPASAVFASGDTLEIVDIMGEGMSLATDHEDGDHECDAFQVYDVTNMSDQDLLSDDGSVNVANVISQGTKITDQCSIQDVTGKSYSGMTDDEVGKPTYLITVPNGTHVAVVYWATFEGAEGEDVTVTNRASFLYEGSLQNAGGDKTEDHVAAAAASSTMYVGTWFNIKKTDQFGNIVPGATFELYKVTVDSSGKMSLGDPIMTQTTNAKGVATFGHRSTDSGEELTKDQLYCLVETYAPKGYKMDSNPYYFEFRKTGSDKVPIPTGVTLHQFVSGGTYSMINEFQPATYTVPVKKTINGKTTGSEIPFSFTLTKTSGDTVYTTENLGNELGDAGIQTTIQGTGTTNFDTLYFSKAGTYVFSIQENALSAEATGSGYTKDDNQFTLTLEVGYGTDGLLAVTSATYSDANGKTGTLPGDTITFDNKCNLSGTLTLKATKEVTGRTKPVGVGEFGFTVSAGGKVIAEKNADGSDVLNADGTPKKQVFYTSAGGEIVFNIPITQDDIGTKTYVISEVEGNDKTISYTDDRVRVKVTIEEDGKGGLTATSINYLTDAVFTNTYVASGTLSLIGVKNLTQQSTGADIQQYQDEFRFEVYEGTTRVATGTSDKNGKITFSDLVYFASDVGDHFYTISEIDDGELFVEYSQETVDLKVSVADAGNGVLSTTVYYKDSTGDYQLLTKSDDGSYLAGTKNPITFNNTFTLATPTGVRLDVIPFFIICAFAAAALAFRFVRKRRVSR